MSYLLTRTMSYLWRYGSNIKYIGFFMAPFFYLSICKSRCDKFNHVDGGVMVCVFCC